MHVWHGCSVVAGSSMADGNRKRDILGKEYPECGINLKIGLGMKADRGSRTG